MTPREEARKRARLLNAWADKETLQYRLVGVWTDYDGIEIPRIPHPSIWRIKPRRMWTSQNWTTDDQERAKLWEENGHKVTEWQEVLK